MTHPARRRYKEIHPKIYKITLPLPGDKPGPVNVYLFLGKQVTLLDTGTLKTAKLLQAVLNEIGVSFSDINQIVLTHGHLDHYGAARRIIAGSKGGIAIVGHREDKNLVEQGWDVPRKQFAKYFKLMGVPLTHQFSLLLVRWVFASMAESASIDRFLSDGEKILMGDYEATVIATPGHTRGSISLYLEKEKMLFSGDQVLAHITPNAFVMLEADVDLPRRLSQVEFYESLRKLEALAPRMVYPAHGKPIADLAETAAMFREQFSLRQKKILSILGEGPATVYRIARKLFPDIRGWRLPLEIYLAVSEVYTHLQVLEKENVVASTSTNKVLYFKIIKQSNANE
jgi:glyoxylase-like metal-dependent hydrolase (beta-lactamase superfamily II)